MRKNFQTEETTKMKALEAEMNLTDGLEKGMVASV